MKVERNGASITIDNETRIKIAEKIPYKFGVLFDILYFTGCRISEGIQIRWIDVVGNTIVLRKSNTKGKTATRDTGNKHIFITYPILPLLLLMLHQHQQNLLCVLLVLMLLVVPLPLSNPVPVML